jgi:carbon monoxide dehydrogenase subunit G
MKKHYSLQIALLIFLTGCASSRTYIPTFISQSREALSLDKPVLFSVIDQRTTSDDRKEMVASINHGLLQTYAHSLKSIDFFEKQPDSSVKVEVRVMALSAEFGVRMIDQSYIYTQNSTAVAAAGGRWSGVVAAASSSQSFISTQQAQGHWVGTAHLEITVTDNRSGKRKFTVPLVGEDDEPNTWGYSSASTANEKAWRLVEQGLVTTFDKVILNVRDGS